MAHRARTVYYCTAPCYNLLQVTWLLCTHLCTVLHVLYCTTGDAATMHPLMHYTVLQVTRLPCTHLCTVLHALYCTTGDAATMHPLAPHSLRGGATPQTYSGPCEPASALWIGTL